MKQKEQREAVAQKSEAQVDPDAVCEKCGAFGAFHLGDQTVCQECYEGCGSCCPEFGKDDLWASREKD